MIFKVIFDGSFEICFSENIAKHIHDKRAFRVPPGSSATAMSDRNMILLFGFENFDGIGAWRDTDGGFRVDAAGALVTGEVFNGPAELKRLLDLRESLKSLKGPMSNVPEFRKKIQELVKDETARKQLLKEMGIEE